MTAVTELQTAYLHAIVDVVRRYPLGQLAVIAVVLRAGEKPHVWPRRELARHLRDAGLELEASTVDRAKVPKAHVLAWFESDEGTGSHVVRVRKLPGERGTFATELPCDDVIASLMETS